MLGDLFSFRSIIVCIFVIYLLYGYNFNYLNLMVTLCLLV